MNTNLGHLRETTGKRSWLRSGWIRNRLKKRRATEVEAFTPIARQCVSACVARFLQ
jgi:hypothetical protein